MNTFSIRILLALVAVSGHVSWCVHSAEGSWFDGMDFEEYHPPKDNGNGDKEIPQRVAYRIPCGIMTDGASTDVMPLSTLVDLDLPTSTIHESFLLSKFDKDELDKLMVPSDDDKAATKNGTQPMIIPSGSLWLRMGSHRATVLAPTLQVIQKDDVTTNGNDPLHDDGIQLKLGMNFIAKHQGRLDVDGAGGLIIKVTSEDDGIEKEETVLIPVWRPRAPINSHEDL